MLRDPEYFAAIETVGEKELDDDNTCYRVRLEWQSGRESFDCYHAESGLLVEMEMTQPSPMGEISSVTRMSDYQEFGDGRIATRTSIQVMGQVASRKWNSTARMHPCSSRRRPSRPSSRTAEPAAGAAYFSGDSNPSANSRSDSSPANRHRPPERTT